MASKGLKFAAATEGDEAAYQALHSALAAYDVAWNASSPRPRLLPCERLRDLRFALALARRERSRGEMVSPATFSWAGRSLEESVDLLPQGEPSSRSSTDNFFQRAPLAQSVRSGSASHG